MLRMYYAHVQMVLYRPFLHHALKDVRRSSRVSLKAYACGSACIKAAMQVVWLAERMEASNLFNAAHWFVTLIVAFTAACLVLFVTSNQGDPTVDDIADAVRRIRGLCSRHAEKNVSMRRCLHFLEVRDHSPPSLDLAGTALLYAPDTEPARRAYHSLPAIRSPVQVPTTKPGIVLTRISTITSTRRSACRRMMRRTARTCRKGLMAMESCCRRIICRS